MADWLTLEQALGAPGLRVAPVRAGLPSPWSEFIRACFDAKRVPYSLVDAFLRRHPPCEAWILLLRFLSPITVPGGLQIKVSQ